MRTIVLVSGDPKTHEHIQSMLPKGAALELFPSVEALPRPGAGPAGSYAGKIILVDLSRAVLPAGRIEPFRLAGVPLVALIDEPAAREAAFHAGFDDYLLAPVSAAELKTRLERLAPAPRGSSAAVELERRAAIGRLTSYFCHAVNNSLQTIRGSVDLALEESDVPPPIAEYLAICRKETAVIGAKINRLRQIYRSQPSPPEPVALDKLLHETLAMATDDLLRNSVSAREQFEPSLPAVHGSGDRLALAFLLMIFHLSGELGGRGGGELLARTGREPGFALAELDAAPRAPSAAAAIESVDSIPAGLEPARDLLQAERGRLQMFQRGGSLSLKVQFPVAGA